MYCITGMLLRICTDATLENTKEDVQEDVSHPDEVYWTHTSVLTEVFKGNGEVASKNDIPTFKT